MDEIDTRSSDVAIVGGGPAGISAALQLAACPGLQVDLFEYEPELGGIPQSAHIFFGMRDQRRMTTGPAYVRRLVRRLEQTATAVHTGSTVVEIQPDPAGRTHRVFVAGSAGLACYRCRFLVLATGCYESSRENRLLAGTRPAGVMTTGTLQKLVNLRHLVPGRRAVILGSEHVALSAAMTLNRAGVRIQALVEPDRHLHTYPAAAGAFARWLRFPVYTQTAVRAVRGKDRVQGIELTHPGGRGTIHVPCDTVVVTGRFRPESALILQTGILEDPRSGGPVVDLDLRTAIPGIYAAGNVLRGANMHDLCALEGRRAARGIIADLEGRETAGGRGVSIIPEGAVRFAVPQKIMPDRLGNFRTSVFRAGPTFQVNRTLRHATMAAISGGRTLWRKTYRRLLANTSVPLPVERFDWQGVDPVRGIRLKCLPGAGDR